MNVPKAQYEIIYNGKNITGSIMPFVRSVTYTDKTKAEADEIEIEVEDTQGLWANEWYPQKGDTIAARITLLSQVLECGTFTIDEITGSGSIEGNVMSIKGIAAGINKKIRTKNCYAHENKKLREIVNTIAAKHGLTVVGKISDVRIGRETQYNETDLHFLQRLAASFGYTFSVRDKSLVFTDVFELEDKAEALNIKRTEMISWNITDKTADTYKNVHVSYHNPRDKKTITNTQKEGKAANETVKDDTLVIKKRVENEQQAEIKGKVALYLANTLQQSGTVEMPGNILALAGNNCTLEGIGFFSGKYHIVTSTHTVIPDSGYTTSLEVKRLGVIAKEKQKDA